MLTELALLVTGTSTAVTSTLAYRQHRRLRTDALTGLANRTALYAAFHRARRRHRQGMIGLALGDLRRFKVVNDVHGHRVGDQVLVEVTDRLRRATRGGELAVRLHGDELAVLLPRVADQAAAERRVGEIQQQVNAPLVVAGEHVDTGLDVGVMTAPAATAELSALLASADDRMYGTKHAHRTVQRPTVLDTAVA